MDFISKVRRQPVLILDITDANNVCVAARKLLLCKLWHIPRKAVSEMLTKYLVPSVVLLYANGASKYFENQETHMGFKELCFKLLTLNYLY